MRTIPMAIGTAVALVVMLIGMPLSMATPTYYYVNNPGGTGAVIGAWASGSTWDGSGANAWADGAYGDMGTNPNPSFVINADFTDTKVYTGGIPPYYLVSLPPDNVTIVDVKVGVIGVSPGWLDEGFLSFIYSPTNVPYSDKPWLTFYGGAYHPLSWFNSTNYSFVQNPAATSHWWDVTNLYGWTPAILKSNDLYVMWTQDQNRTHTIIDYVGIFWAWQYNNGTIGAPPYEPQRNWTPSPYNFGGWFSTGLFLGIIGAMGLIGMVATPAIYVANRDHEDSVTSVAMTIFQFVLFMGMFLAWIYVS